MKKKLFLLILPFAIAILSSSSPSTPAWEKENVSFPMMNQEIRHSMFENERQKNMNELQTKNLGVEKLNQKQWEKFKVIKAKIQDRLRIIDFAVQSIPTGYAITLEAQSITKIQNEIFREIESTPYVALVAIPSEIQFVDDMQMIVRFLVGIVVSYGAINQMEKAERKILLDYALSEVNQLTRNSISTLYKIKFFKQKIALQKGMLEFYKNRDIQIVKDIMGEIKSF